MELWDSAAKSSPGTWCKCSLVSSVNASVAQAAMSSPTSSSVLRGRVFSDRGA
jgi:hypothetical protein